MRNRFAADGASETEQIVKLEVRVLELIIGIAKRKRFSKFELIAHYRDITNTSYPDASEYIGSLMGERDHVTGQVVGPIPAESNPTGGGAPPATTVDTEPYLPYRPDMEETPLLNCPNIPEVFREAPPNIRIRAPSGMLMAVEERLQILENALRGYDLEAVCARLESVENRLPSTWPSPTVDMGFTIERENVVPLTQRHPQFTHGEAFDHIDRRLQSVENQSRDQQQLITSIIENMEMVESDYERTVPTTHPNITTHPVVVTDAVLTTQVPSMATSLVSAGEAVNASAGALPTAGMLNQYRDALNQQIDEDYRRAVASGIESGDECARILHEELQEDINRRTEHAAPSPETSFSFVSGEPNTMSENFRSWYSSFMRGLRSNES